MAHSLLGGVEMESYRGRACLCGGVLHEIPLFSRRDFHKHKLTSKYIRRFLECPKVREV
jgi:hypothetical protein